MNNICDFCSEPTVTWTYPARTFAAYIVAGVVGESVGEWAACPTCHTLIENGNRFELVERSLETLVEKHPEMRFAEPELRAQIRSFHTMFFANRTGDAVPAIREERRQHGRGAKEGHP